MIALLLTAAVVTAGACQHDRASPVDQTLGVTRTASTETEVPILSLTIRLAPGSRVSITTIEGVELGTLYGYGAATYRRFELAIPETALGDDLSSVVIRPLSGAGGFRAEAAELTVPAPR